MFPQGSMCATRIYVALKVRSPYIGTKGQSNHAIWEHGPLYPKPLWYPFRTLKRNPLKEPFRVIPMWTHGPVGFFHLATHLPAPQPSHAEVAWNT